MPLKLDYKTRNLNPPIKHIKSSKPTSFQAKNFGLFSFLMPYTRFPITAPCWSPGGLFIYPRPISYRQRE